MLMGSWLVYCPRCKQHERVEGVTVSHACEKCGNVTVSAGALQLLCPHDGCGQVDGVGGVTTQHDCSKCGRSMRLG